MTTQHFAFRMGRPSAFFAAVLVALTSTAFAQPATAPATAAPTPAAPAAAPVAATPVAPVAAPVAAPAASPVEVTVPAPTVGAVQPGFPEPAAQPSAPAAVPAASPTAELSAGTFSVTSAPALVVAEPVTADPNEATVRFKPGKGVDIKSADGNFLLNTRLRLQFLDELRSPAAKGEKTRNDLILRRVRLTFGGNVFSKDIKYKLEIALGTPELGREPVAVVNKSDVSSMGASVNAAGAPVVLSTDRDVMTQGPIIDAYVDFTQIRDANLHVGQGKVPFGLERMMSDGDLRTVDRSVATETFGFDRDIGFDIRSQDFLGLDKLRYYAGIYSGEGRNATLKSAGHGDLGLVYVVRAELFPLGTFDLSEASDFARTSDAKLAFGIAYAFLQADASSPAASKETGVAPLGPVGGIAVVDYNAHNFTADVTLKLAGFSANTAFFYRKVTPFIGASDGMGWTLQSGYILSEEVPLEIAGAFAMVRPIERATSNIKEHTEVGGGLNYYFYGQAFKVQAEYMHLWEQNVSGKADNRVRVQLQASL